MTCWACGGDRWLHSCPYCKEITMNDVEKFFRGILDSIKDVVSPAKTTELEKLWKSVLDTVKDTVTPPKTTVKDMGMNKKQIEVELPAPPPSGGFAGCPSGDTEYEEAMREWEKDCNAQILAAIPRGYSLKSSEVKEERIVRHYANIVVEKS